jgi:hypothetical protein
VRKIAWTELWGQRAGPVVYERARADIDAISDFLGSKPFFMADRLRSIDANVLSALNHIFGTPFNFDTKDIEGKKNLADYRARLNARFGKP